MEKTLVWKEVLKTHGTISGIGTKDGIVKSLLCTSGKNQPYPNKIEGDKIIYFVGPQTNSGGIKALFNSIEKKNTFPVFTKLGINKWKKLGQYKAISVKEEKDNYVSFTLSSI